MYPVSNRQRKAGDRRTLLRTLGAFGVGVAIMATPLLSGAHGPSRLKVTESVTIDAPPGKVWAVVGDYAGIHRWLPMVESSVGDDVLAEGAKRTLTLSEGVEIHETLKKYDADKMMYKYKIPDATHDVNILPVTNYAATISVKADGDGSLVTWKGGFYRGHPNYDPPEDQNDETAINTITEIYQLSLENLKKLVEAD